MTQRNPGETWIEKRGYDVMAEEAARVERLAAEPVPAVDPAARVALYIVTDRGELGTLPGTRRAVMLAARASDAALIAADRWNVPESRIEAGRVGDYEPGNTGAALAASSPAGWPFLVIDEPEPDDEAGRAYTTAGGRRMNPAV